MLFCYWYISLLHLCIYLASFIFYILHFKNCDITAIHAPSLYSWNIDLRQMVIICTQFFSAALCMCMLYNELITASLFEMYIIINNEYITYIKKYWLFRWIHLFFLLPSLYVYRLTSYAFTQETHFKTEQSHVLLEPIYRRIRDCYRIKIIATYIPFAEPRKSSGFHLTHYANDGNAPITATTTAEATTTR